MHFKIIGCSLITGLMSAAALAEPAVQPGDTLESLSKVKISTTVNGQPGSLEELLSSGKIRLADSQTAAAPETAQQGAEGAPQQTASREAGSSAELPQGADMQQAAQQESLNSSQDESAMQNAPAIAPPAQPADQDSATQAMQQAMQNDAQSAVPDSAAAAQESAQAQAPAVMAADGEAAAAPTIVSSADAPVNAESAMPEGADQAIQAAPEAPAAEQPLQVSPEAPDSLAVPETQQ